MPPAAERGPGAAAPLQPHDAATGAGRRRADAGDTPPPARRIADPEATSVAQPGLPPAGPEPAVDVEATTRVPADPRESEEDTGAAAEDRRRRIDESLTRLTAAHAGLLLARDDEPGGDSDPDDESDPDDGPPDRLAAGPREPDDPRRHRRVLAVRLLAAGVAVLVFATTALGWAAKTWLDSTIRSVAALDLESSAIVDAKSQAGDENVLLLGLDAGASGTSFVPGAGSDTIVLAHVPAGGTAITTVAFPRDLEINRPPCQRWDPAAAAYLDQTVPAETRTKLDTAFQVGGPRCAVKVIQQLTGLAITRFVALDVTGLGAMVDAVHGVSVCLEHPVVDGVLGPVVPAAGTNALDGGRAMDLVRARHVQGDPPSDQGLIQRQQRVLAALLRKALSNEVLLNPGTLRAFAGEFGRSTLSDGAGLDELVALARSLQHLDGGGVTFVTTPTTGEASTRGNEVLRDRDAAALFTALRKNAPLPDGAITPPSATAAAPAPSTITLDVLNASGRTGLAGQIGGTLRELGFTVGSVGNAPQPAAETVIRFSPDRSAPAQVLASTVPSARPVPDTGSSGRLELVLGTSFDGTVRAPLEAGPATARPAAAQVTCT